MDQLARIALAQRKLESAEAILWNYLNEPELKKVLGLVADAEVHLSKLKKDLEWHRPSTPNSRRQGVHDLSKNVTFADGDSNTGVSTDPR